MKRPETEYVLYIQGLGRKPAVQENVTDLGQTHGLTIERLVPDYSGLDCRGFLWDTITHLQRLPPNWRKSVIGASGASKFVPILMYMLPGFLHRGAAINGKANPWDHDAEELAMFPILQESSNIMERICPKMPPSLFSKIMWAHSLTDERIPDQTILPGTQELILQTNGHAQGIEDALTNRLADIADFIKQD